MLNKIARGGFLLFLALMIVSWAMSAGKSMPIEEQPEQQQPSTWQVYC